MLYSLGGLKMSENTIILEAFVNKTKQAVANNHYCKIEFLSTSFFTFMKNESYELNLDTLDYSDFNMDNPISQRLFYEIMERYIRVYSNLAYGIRNMLTENMYLVVKGNFWRIIEFCESYNVVKSIDSNPIDVNEVLL